MNAMKKQFWSEIFLYGLSIALMLVAIQFLQYRWILLKNATEWYSAVLALLFCTAGIWAGMKLSKRNKTELPVRQADMQTGIALSGITPRELEVLQLMARGHSNQEIANLLFVSLNTVKTHISSLLSKLDAQRRTQAIQKAKSLGIIP